MCTCLCLLALLLCPAPPQPPFARPSCRYQTVLAAYCNTALHAAPTNTRPCRYQTVLAAYNNATDDYHSAETDAKKETNSMVFNTFIWLQARCWRVYGVQNGVLKQRRARARGAHARARAHVRCTLPPALPPPPHPPMFNMINARKINDEYNVFAGILASHTFSVIWVLVAAFQVRGLEGGVEWVDWWANG